MEDVKNDIRAHLKIAKEASAKQMAKATGRSESEIANALNSMRVYAEVECEQGGRGKGMIYWLTNATEVDGDMQTDKACCNAAKVVATTAGSEVSFLREQLTDAEQIIANARQALKVKEGESLVLAIERLVADRNAHRDDVLNWERTMMKLVGEDGIGSVTKSIENMQAEIAYKAGVIDDYQAKLGHARVQIDALNEQLMHGEDAVDVKDAARGYLVCAPKRKPAKFYKPETAVAKAKAAAKTTGRCDVFALVPVGVATRKQIQAVEFKERAA